MHNDDIELRNSATSDGFLTLINEFYKRHKVKKSVGLKEWMNCTFSDHLDYQQWTCSTDVKKHIKEGIENFEQNFVYCLQSPQTSLKDLHTPQNACNNHTTMPSSI